MTDMMAQYKNLSDNQYKSLATVLVLMLEAGATEHSEAGEISHYAIQKSKATLTAVFALERKGILVRRQGTMIMPEGPYKGEETLMSWWTAA